MVSVVGIRVSSEYVWGAIHKGKQVTQNVDIEECDQRIPNASISSVRLELSINIQGTQKSYVPIIMLKIPPSANSSIPQCPWTTHVDDIPDLLQGMEPHNLLKVGKQRIAIGRVWEVSDRRVAWPRDDRCEQDPN